MADSIIREFLIKLGFQVDLPGQTHFIDGVIEATRAVAELAAGSIAAAGAVVASVAKMAQAGDELYWISQRTKASAANILAFGFAASQMGSSVEAARSSLEGLANFIRSNPGAKSLISSLGVNPNEDTTQMMQDLGARFAKMPQYLAQRYAGMMGIDQNTLRAMTAGMGEYAKQYTDMLQSAGVNEKSATEGAHDFMVQLRLLFAAFDILGQKVGQTLYRSVGNNIKNFRMLIVNNFQAISDWIVAAAQKIIVFADVVMQLIRRAGQAFNDLRAWYNGLTPEQKSYAKSLLEIVAAFVALNKILKSGPLGLLWTFLLVMGLIYDDWKTWKEGGKHFIDWDYWDPEIRKALKVLEEVREKIVSLTDAIAGPNGMHKALEALATYMAISWVAKITGAFGKAGLAGDGLLGKLNKMNLLMIAFNAWYKLQEMNNDQDPRNYAIDSPFWHGIPVSEQKLFPNSPYNQSLNPTPKTGWSKYTPSELAKKAWNWATGGKPDVSGVNAKDMSPTDKALLDTLASGESGGDYARVYGNNPDVNNFIDHPHKEYAIDESKPVGKGNETSAAGRYQFEKDTWDTLKKTLNLKDFGPQNQDVAALYLAKSDYAHRTGRDLEADLNSGNYSRVSQALGALQKTWSSVNGGSDKVSEFMGHLKAYTAAAAQPNANYKSPMEKLQDAQAATGQGVPSSYRGGSSRGASTGDAIHSLAHPGQNMMRPTVPAGAAGMAAANQNVHQTNTVTVHGAGDPHKTADLITRAQSRQNADLIRNLGTRLT
jgi:muramidase (phage lysozyme)